MLPDDPSPIARYALAVYAAMSAVTFLAYGLDKSAAARGGRRTPAKTLHLLALLGGWPGALLAMAVFQHKTRRGAFLLTVSLIALAHVAGWGWWSRFT